MNYKLFSAERGKGKHQSCRACVQQSVQAHVFTHQSPVRAPSQGLQGSFSISDNCHKGHQAPYVRNNPAELGGPNEAHQCHEDARVLTLFTCVCLV